MPAVADTACCSCFPLAMHPRARSPAASALPPLSRAPARDLQLSAGGAHCPHWQLFKNGKQQLIGEVLYTCFHYCCMRSRSISSGRPQRRRGKVAQQLWPPECRTPGLMRTTEADRRMVKDKAGAHAPGHLTCGCLVAGSRGRRQQVCLTSRQHIVGALIEGKHST